MRRTETAQQAWLPFWILFAKAVLLAALARIRAQRHTLTHSALDEYYAAAKPHADKPFWECTPLSSDHFALDVFLEELVSW